MSGRALRLSSPPWRFGGAASFGAVLVVAALLALVCRQFPARLPAVAPYDFSWIEFLALALPLVWYVAGVARMEAAARPSGVRRCGFGLGVGLIYTVLLTHFDYMAQHMFFLSRLQHLVLHHLGPFLIALSWPGAALHSGMPAPLRVVLEHPVLRRTIRALQQPFLAGVVFVGVIDLWLIPAVNFRAMIDPQLYAIMNWSMVVDGMFFWLFILDPRASPPARSSFAIRLLTVILVVFPQILVGSYLTFTTTDLYPFYDLCGRLYPSIDAVLDQHLGGLLVWIPASMMSAIAFMLTLNHLRLREDARPVAAMTAEERRISELSSRWTGR